MIKTSIEEYLELIQKVYTIDKEAGVHLRNFLFEEKDIAFTPCRDLGLCFLWSETNQGYDYWRDITIKLIKEKFYEL